MNWWHRILKSEILGWVQILIEAVWGINSLDWLYTDVTLFLPKLLNFAVFVICVVNLSLLYWFWHFNDTSQLSLATSKLIKIINYDNQLKIEAHSTILAKFYCEHPVLSPTASPTKIYIFVLIDKLILQRLTQRPSHFL